MRPNVIFGYSCGIPYLGDRNQGVEAAMSKLTYPSTSAAHACNVPLSAAGLCFVGHQGAALRERMDHRHHVQPVMPERLGFAIERVARLVHLSHALKA